MKPDCDYHRRIEDKKCLHTKEKVQPTEVSGLVTLLFVVGAWVLIMLILHFASSIDQLVF